MTAKGSDMWPGHRPPPRGDSLGLPRALRIHPPRLEGGEGGHRCPGRRPHARGSWSRRLATPRLSGPRGACSRLSRAGAGCGPQRRVSGRCPASVRTDTRRPPPSSRSESAVHLAQLGATSAPGAHHDSRRNRHNSGGTQGGAPDLVTATPRSYRWPVAPGWRRCGNYSGTLKRSDNKIIVTRYAMSVGKRSRDEKNGLRVSPYGVV